MVKFISLDTRRVKKKENQFIQIIKDVILLQETYLTTKYECNQFLENLGLKSGHFASRSQFSGGTATLLSSNKYKMENEGVDSQERTCYKTVVGENDERWTIIDSYAPQKRSKEQTEYFNDCEGKEFFFQTSVIIL